MRPEPGRGGGRLSAGVDLGRFTAAQDGGVHERAVAELRAGDKRGHWMWFEFPQLDGLGPSPMARRYALSGIAQARAYLADPRLGAHLRECCEALLSLPADASAIGVLGPVDALKLRSSVTLFGRAVDGPDSVFGRVLARFYDGLEDPLTVARLTPGE